MRILVIEDEPRILDFVSRGLEADGFAVDGAGDGARGLARALSERYDLVILDAPATGHALAMLAAPRTFAEAARVGPINRQGGLIHEMLSDPARTAVVGVTTPEEMPVNETLTLEARLRDEMGLDLALVVVNRVHRVGLTAGERRVLAGRDTHPAIAAALAQDRLAQAGRAQLQRLRRRVGAPTCTLSFVAGDVELDTLARRLGRAV